VIRPGLAPEVSDMIWLELGVCAGLIIAAATVLSRYGDVLAEKTGLGRAWVGGILVAGVTSLPELVSGVSAVAWLQAPNLAAGAVLGSCLFNVALIALVDLLYQPGSILAKAQEGHILSGGPGVLLLGLVAAGALLGPAITGVGTFGFSLISLVIALLYVIGARLIAQFEQRRLAEVLQREAEARHYDQVSAARAYSVFSLSARAVVALGVWLAFIGFNVALLAVFDLADGAANFWASLSAPNAVAAGIASMMTGVTIISLIYRASPRTPYRLNWAGAALIVMYISAMLVLYRMG
jgi:cation:H+ antiporter